MSMVNIINIINDNSTGFENLEDLIIGFSRSTLNGELEISYRATPNGIATFNTVEHRVFSNSKQFNYNEVYFAKIRLKTGPNNTKGICFINSIELFTEVKKSSRKIEMEQYLVMTIKNDSEVLNIVEEMFKEKNIQYKFMGNVSSGTLLIKVNMSAKDFFRKI